MTAAELLMSDKKKYLPMSQIEFAEAYLEHRAGAIGDEEIVEYSKTITSFDAFQETLQKGANWYKQQLLNNK